MCFKRPKVQAPPAPVQTTPAYVEPATSQSNAAQAAPGLSPTGVAIKGYDGNGSTNIASSNSQGDTDDMAIRRRRRSAAAGLGL